MPNEIRLDVSNPGPFAISPVSVRTNNARSDDQDQRECNLNRDDGLSKPDAAKCQCRLAPGATRSTIARPACRAGAKPLRTPAATLTRNAKSNRRESTDGVQGVRRRVARQERDERPHRKRGEQHSERSTSKREQDAVGEKLPADPPARSAQRQPCADLTVASRSARQEETGDIQAGQTQQHRRCREQDPERLRQPAPQNWNGLVAPE